MMTGVGRELDHLEKILRVAVLNMEILDE